MTKIHDLLNEQQSIWVDYIRRSFITDGGLQRMIDSGVRGVTSNPAIFEKAIAGSTDYDADLKPLVDAGKTLIEIYEALAIDDIQRAADLMRPVYDESNGLDGYVSLEVSPTLANNTDGTVEEARRLWSALARENIMIKVPATPAGVPAIETLIAEGINVNVTLIFSVEQYEAVANAYIAGLEKRSAAGADLSSGASVASFFISRVDGKADDALDAKGHSELIGKIAIANAKIAYERFALLFGDARWEKLAEAGANVQRPLWASTSTKNPTLPDTLYVDQLIGPHTVNTVPPATMTAFLDHGAVATTLTEGVAEARTQLNELAELGIDLGQITQELQDDGVAKFEQAFEKLMASIEEKRDKLLEGWDQLEMQLGEYQGMVDKATAEIRDEGIMHRIWQHDHTVWSDSPQEITNRLGWLHIAEVMEGSVTRMMTLANRVQQDGMTHVLLLGMGGSSLAPEVFSITFGDSVDGMALAVLDSTDPGQVLEHHNRLDLSKTLFIVATKSGGTAETLSAFKYFYNETAKIVGDDAVGGHFVAITDPGSKLVDIADRYGFRATFLNDPNIGGRYSALSYFGLVPAALVGVDLETLLDRAVKMAVNCDENNCPSAGDNNGGRLGAVMGELAKAGRDKITLITSPAIASFGDWVEQLIAESTGKDGKGILPVVGEAVGAPEVYGDDRLFAYLRLKDDDTYDAQMQALVDAGHPLVTLHLDDVYDMGGQFFLWEMATAVAGYRIGIQPFDQPNVEAAKNLARAMIKEYEEKGKLPELEPTMEADGIAVYGDVSADSPAAALTAFLDQADKGAYISLQAFVHYTAETEAALQELRLALRDKYKFATTLGFGPRFLHSTGQLHKGDGGSGMFIQFTADMPQDVDIPDEAGAPESTMTFGTLKEAQALGDRQALLDVNRQVIRFRVGADVSTDVKKLMES